MSFLWEMFRYIDAFSPLPLVMKVFFSLGLLAVALALLWVACAVLILFLTFILNAVDFWKIHKRTLLPVVALVLTMVLLSADGALAQGFGGGGQFLDGVRQYLMGPVLTTILVLAVIGIAIALMATHHGIAGVIWIAVGAFLWANADTIAGYLH